MLGQGANLQKISNGDKTYAITPHLPGGFIKPEVLEKYAHVVRKYNGALKLTSAQRIMITGLKDDDIENIWGDLGMQPALSFATVSVASKYALELRFASGGNRTVSNWE